MKKIKLRMLGLSVNDLFSREQMKKVMGGAAVGVVLMEVQLMRTAIQVSTALNLKAYQAAKNFRLVQVA